MFLGTRQTAATVRPSHHATTDNDIIDIIDGYGAWYGYNAFAGPHII